MDVSAAAIFQGLEKWCWIFSKGWKCGFGEEWERRALARVPAASVSHETIQRYLVWVSFHSPEVKKLIGHVERMNAGVIGMLSLPIGLQRLTPNLLREVGHDPLQDRPNSPIAYIFGATCQMGELVGWSGFPAKFGSVKALYRTHDRLARQIRPERLFPDSPPPERFAPPPFRGTEHIRPLRTPNELAEEGYVMKHCAGVQAPKVAAGEMYVYRVLAPVRATLSIRVRARQWEPDVLVQACNKSVGGYLRSQLFEELFASGPFVEDDGLDIPGYLPAERVPELWNSPFLRLIRKNFVEPDHGQMEWPM